MKSLEHLVAPASEYYIYSPSKVAQSMFLYPLRCGVFTYEPGYRLVRRAFNSFLLMYIQKGAIQLETSGQAQTVQAGHFILLDCYQPHAYATDTGYTCLWLHFDGIQARSYYQLITSRLGPVWDMEDVSPALRKLTAILRTFQEHLTVQEPLLSKYITDLLTEFMIYTPRTIRRRSNALLAEETITFINDHFHENISTEQLAAMHGVSVYHFIRIFKQETGYTPHEYLIRRRMASVRYLLQFSTLSIKAICYDTGFSSESVFCNAFKKMHGLTPLQYRESCTPKGTASENIPITKDIR